MAESGGKKNIGVRSKTNERTEPILRFDDKMLELMFNIFCGDRFVNKWRSLTVTLFNLLYYILRNLFVLLISPIPIFIGALLILTSPILLSVFSTKSPLKKVFFYFAAYTIIPILSYV